MIAICLLEVRMQAQLTIVERASSLSCHPSGLTADYFKKWPGTLWNTEAWERMEAAGSHSQTSSPLTRGVVMTAWGTQPYQHWSDGTQCSLTAVWSGAPKAPILQPLLPQVATNQYSLLFIATDAAQKLFVPGKVALGTTQ